MLYTCRHWLHWGCLVAAFLMLLPLFAILLASRSEAKEY